MKDKEVFSCRCRPCRMRPAKRRRVGVSSLSLVRYRMNDYSVPTAYGHQKVLIRGYVHEVVIACGAVIIARHARSYEREDMVFNPLHYLALMEQKTNALDQAAPLAGWELPEGFDTAAVDGSPHGQEGQARVCAGAALDGDVRGRRRAAGVRDAIAAARSASTP